MSEEIVENQEEQLEEETQEEELEDQEETFEDEEDSIEDDSEEEVIDWEARAKKAEALLIQNKRKAKENKAVKPATSTLSEEIVEKKILKSQGMSDELLDQLTKIARLNNTGLIDAQSDPIFVAFKDNLEKEQKSKAARLGASKGSGSVRKEKDFNTPGLSDAEHKELWKRSEGR